MAQYKFVCLGLLFVVLGNKETKINLKIHKKKKKFKNHQKWLKNLKKFFLKKSKKITLKKSRKKFSDKKCYTFSFPILGGRDLTRAL